MASKIKKREARKGLLISSTYLIYAAIFWGYPFVWLLILAFSRWRYVGSPRFAGLRNFIRVLYDPIFWKSFFNVLNFLMYYIPIVLVFSMLFALALSKLKYGRTFVALSFLVANVSSGVAYSIMFSKLFAENGPLNQMIYKYFHTTIPWFTNPQLAMFSISIIVVWKFIGYYGLILYAGIISIPKSIYEAAELDGANKLVKFFKITLPLLNPSIIMVLVFAISLSFGIFTEPYMITGGGPMRSTLMPMMVMYTSAFQKLDPTYAATMSIFTAILSFSIIWITRRLFEREVSIV
ncbi:permease component of ABC-type sugar transporter [Marinitoga piezophila KA3]|uniref:Permease component of ABC-type sugar transporter n=1 Tax=Marinitoga piezophila (strain DSM 14283 / JCM 11233 / KA3) TaxID=443254 RepID=H2J770_MARPK|nr:MULTISPECIES: sugar ABC transporter permease [Marinitoga]AEX86440.1 permease component of ABC-type sugar transporter [Marinitoga piezophila KA3]APT76828.1 sugar ABC transporter permease [Marinitoga sp. 1137]